MRVAFAFGTICQRPPYTLVSAQAVSALLP